MQDSRRRRAALVQFAAALPLTLSAAAADFTFYGRSGDAILLDFSAQPGNFESATFSNFGLPGSEHVALFSDTLEGSSFAQSGRAWIFANTDSPTGGGLQISSDRDPTQPGHQGLVTGTVDIDGRNYTYEVVVQPGYTGAGRGAVGQSLEGLGRINNPLFVAQQQHRLAYLGFRAEGGRLPEVTGTFDADTDEALRTFQAAFIGGLNTRQDNVDGIIGPNTARWLNAGNAPFWERLEPNADISSVSSFEPYATSWTIDLVRAAAPDAKAATGINQRITALSAVDGYGSSIIHSTHRAGMDIDLGIPLEARNTGNRSLNSGEADAADFARAFIDAHRNHPELDVRVSRILHSNRDVATEVNRTHPGVIVDDGFHATHFHIDVTPLRQDAAPANQLGDFNLDDTLDAADIDVLYANLDGDASVYNLDPFFPSTVTLADVDTLVRGLLGTDYGDANLDGRIDQADLDAVLTGWGSADAGWAGGDMSGNGLVDQADLDAVLTGWGSNFAPSFDGFTVPEPAALGAGLAALAGALIRRRGKS